MIMLMLVVLHQVTPVVQFLLQARPLLAVFVQCTVIDQLVQFAREIGSASCRERV